MTGTRATFGGLCMCCLRTCQEYAVLDSIHLIFFDMPKCGPRKVRYPCVVCDRACGVDMIECSGVPVGCTDNAFCCRWRCSSNSQAPTSRSTVVGAPATKVASSTTRPVYNGKMSIFIAVLLLVYVVEKTTCCRSRIRQIRLCSSQTTSRCSKNVAISPT